jgi:four helix bundle protein
MMDKHDLKQRTKKFALRAMKLVDALPHTSAGRAVGTQLVRCASSVGANYRAALRSRSRAEFIAKLGIVEEEADESGYWLELVIDGALLKRSLVEPLQKEADELTRIFAASIRSAKAERTPRSASANSATSNGKPLPKSEIRNPK